MKVDIEVIGVNETQNAMTKLAALGDTELKKMVGLLLLWVEGDARQSISRGGRTGRIYTTRFWTDGQGRLRRGGERPAHQASAPGEAPKTDMGTLVSNITQQRDPDGRGGTVGSRDRAPHGYWLELGTSKIAPRPWLLPALQRQLKRLDDYMQNVADNITKGAK